MPPRRQKKRSKAYTIRPIESKKQKFSKEGWRRVSWSEYVGFPLKNAELSDEESDDGHVIIRNEPTNRRLDLDGVVAASASTACHSPPAQGKDKPPPLWVQEIREMNARLSAKIPLSTTQDTNRSTEKNEDNGGDVFAENKGGASDVDCSHSSSRLTNNQASMSTHFVPLADLKNQSVYQSENSESSQSGPEQGTAVLDNNIANGGIGADLKVCSAVENNPAREGTDAERLHQEHIQKMVDDLVSKIDPLQPKQEDDEKADAERTKEVGLTLKACKSHWQKQFNMPKLTFKELFEEALTKVLAICTWFKINGRSSTGSPNPVSPENSSSENGDTQDDKENAGKEQGKGDGTPNSEAMASQNNLAANEVAKEPSPEHRDKSCQRSSDSGSGLSNTSQERDIVKHGTTSNMKKSTESSHAKAEPTKTRNNKNTAASARNVKQPAEEKKEEAADNVVVIDDSDDDDDATTQINENDAAGNDSDSDILECWVASDKEQFTGSKATAVKGSGGNVKAE